MKRPIMTVVIAVIRRGDGKVLMELRRPDVPQPSMWGFPGGKVKLGELPVRALKREIEEELAMQIERCTLIGRCSYNRPQHRMEIAAYLCETTGEAQKLSAIDLRWVDFPEAIEKLPCAPSTYLLFDQIMTAIGIWSPEDEAWTPTGERYVFQRPENGKGFSAKLVVKIPVDRCTASWSLQWRYRRPGSTNGADGLFEGSAPDLIAAKYEADKAVKSLIGIFTDAGV